jgi:hypothetical protein
VVKTAGSGVIGERGKNVDGDAQSVPIGYPGAIAVNAKNSDVYFVDRETHSVRKFSQGMLYKKIKCKIKYKNIKTRINCLQPQANLLPSREPENLGSLMDQGKVHYSTTLKESPFSRVMGLSLWQTRATTGFARFPQMVHILFFKKIYLI